MYEHENLITHNICIRIELFSLGIIKIIITFPFVWFNAISLDDFSKNCANNPVYVTANVRIDSRQIMFAATCITTGRCNTELDITHLSVFIGYSGKKWSTRIGATCTTFIDATGTEKLIGCEVILLIDIFTSVQIL